MSSKVGAIGKATMEALRDSAGRMAIDGGVVIKGAMNNVRSEAMSRVEGMGVDEG